VFVEVRRWNELFFIGWMGIFGFWDLASICRVAESGTSATKESHLEGAAFLVLERIAWGNLFTVIAHNGLE
jgi:hypothetical protein